MDNAEIFDECRCKLKQASYDDFNKEYMTLSELEVVNFDAVKNKYVSVNNLNSSPSSNDALYFEKDKTFFIEFKNGEINGDAKKYGLWHKIYDSLLIFTDITKKDVSYTRSCMEYILVYNEEKNASAVSRASIGKSLGKLARTEHILFGLERFEMYLKRVCTYNQTEFAEKFVKPRERKLL